MLHSIRNALLARHMTQAVMMHELRLQQTAGLFNLWSGDGRRKSAISLVELFFGVVRITQPELFIEAGAKEASASIRAEKLLPLARIAAFEASPHNFEHYSGQPNLRSSRVEYRNIALTKRNGPVTFFVRSAVDGKPVDRLSGKNSLLERTDENVSYEQMIVPGMRLDRVFPRPKPNAIWIDVEGATGDLISGGHRVLRRTQVAIVEMADNENWHGEMRAPDVIRRLLGFGLVPVARDFEYKSQYNVVFVRNSVLRESHEVRRNIEYFLSELSRR